MVTHEPKDGSARRAGERRRAELGEFLKARRARLSPGDFGMPPGSRRRTPGLRREEVALLAGVGVTWYTWLEQGRQINASTQVLDAVARTLRLDRAEREHLYRLAEATPLRTERPRQAIPDGHPRDPAVPRPAAGVPDQQPVRHPAVQRGLRRAVLGVAHDAVRPQEHPVVLRHRADRPGQVPRVRGPRPLPGGAAALGLQPARRRPGLGRGHPPAGQPQPRVRRPVVPARGGRLRAAHPDLPAPAGRAAEPGRQRARGAAHARGTRRGLHAAGRGHPVPDAADPPGRHRPRPPVAAAVTAAS